MALGPVGLGLVSDCTANYSPLVRVDAPFQESSNCQTKEKENKGLFMGLKGARYQNRLAQ
jgi:hypothetical protein